MFFKKSALVLAASLLAMSGAQAVLPNATTNLSVNIVVASSNASTACYLQNGSAAPSLGSTALTANTSYTNGATSDSTFYGNVRVRCDGNDAVPVLISAGAGMHSNGTTRRASGNAGVDFINYKLQVYSAAAMGNSEWDDATAPVFGGSAISTTASTSSSGPTSTSYSTVTMGFQLVVPAGQTVTPATYTDVVLLTATF